MLKKAINNITIKALKFVSYHTPDLIVKEHLCFDAHIIPNDSTDCKLICLFSQTIFTGAAKFTASVIGPKVIGCFWVLLETLNTNLNRYVYQQSPQHYPLARIFGISCGLQYPCFECQYFPCLLFLRLLAFHPLYIKPNLLFCFRLWWIIHPVIFNTNLANRFQAVDGC